MLARFRLMPNAPVGVLVPTGPRGPGPTLEQITAAVEAYLLANPPEAGPPPTPEQIDAAVTAWLTGNLPWAALLAADEAHDLALADLTAALALEAGEREAAIAQAIDDLKAGAPAALDTLLELATRLEDDADAVAALVAQVAAVAQDLADETARATAAEAAHTAAIAGHETRLGVLERLRLHPALRLWRRDLAGARAGLNVAGIALLGDSITEGYYAPTPGQVWGEQLRARLTRLLPQPYSHRFVGMWAAGAGNTWPGGVNPWTYTGTAPVFSADFGWGLRDAWLPQGGKASITFVGTQAAVLVTKSPNSGANGLTMRLDGVATVHNANAAGNTPGAIFATAVVPYGVHVLELETTGVGGTVLEGVVLYDGPADRGGMVLNGGHGGFAAMQFAGNTAWQQLLSLARCAVVVTGLGGNDLNYARTPAQFQADLTTTLARIDAAAAAAAPAYQPGHLILAYPGFGTYPAATWAPYVAAMRAVAALDPANRVVLDLGELLTADGRFVASVAADLVHPDGLGQQWYADRLAEVLLEPPPQQAGAVSPIVLDPRQEPAGRIAWPAQPVVLNGAGNGVGMATWHDASTNGAVPGEMVYRQWLERGTYRGRLNYLRAPSTGQLEVLIGTTSLGVVDTYNAATNSTGAVLPNPATITEPGWYPVRIRKTGAKAAGSTEYTVWFGELVLSRT